MSITQIDDKDCLHIDIVHNLESQDKINHLVSRLKGLGYKVTLALSIDEIKNHPRLAQIRCISMIVPNITRNTISREVCEKIADECLCLFEGEVSIRIRGNLVCTSNQGFICQGLFKAIPCCKSGLIVHKQEGVSFSYLDSLLKRNGATNIVLKEENDIGMKIDFEVPSIFHSDFEKTYLNGSQIQLFRVFDTRTNRDYSSKGIKKEESFHLKAVEIKNSNHFDFSGDDSSIDSRFW